MGRNFYIPDLFIDMPKVGDDFIEWAIEKLKSPEARPGTEKNPRLPDPYVMLSAAIEEGNVIELEDEDSLEKLHIGIGGIDRLASEFEEEEEAQFAEEWRQAEEERKKREKEIQKRLSESERRQSEQDKVLKPWIDELKKPGSNLADKFRNMPPVGDKELEWMRRNIGYRSEEDLQWNTLKDHSNDIVYSLFFSAASLGLIAWSEAAEGYQGVGWNPAAKAA
jgi:hypothetical protein